MSSFQRTSGWESPTWSALSLILDWSNSAFISPVNFSWKTIGWGLFSSALVCSFNVFVESKIFSWELFIGQVSKLIHFKLISLDSSIEFSVVLVNILSVVEPDLESVLMFSCIIIFIHLFFPDFEHEIFMRLNGWFQIEKTDGSNCD